MIVVDTSALMAIVLDEPAAGACEAILVAADEVLISSATLAEALIVSAHRGRRPMMERILARQALTVEAVTATSARDAADAYDVWGKGVHSADLNIMDCFAYSLAKTHGCALLYVGNDFVQTDIRAAKA